MTKKWEYATIFSKNSSDADRVLTVRGEDGWELVSAAAHNVSGIGYEFFLFFKRPVTEPKTEE